MSYYSLQCVVVNTDITPLLLMKDKFGGTIAKRPQDKKHWKLSYRWRLTANGAENFLKEMLPFLLLKKEQAEIALEFQNHIHSLKKRFGGRYSKTPKNEMEIRESFFVRITEAKKVVH